MPADLNPSNIAEQTCAGHASPATATRSGEELPVPALGGILVAAAAETSSTTINIVAVELLS